MGASTDFINAELESKGITDVSADEAFSAWMHLAKYDMDHAVVLRSRAFEPEEILPTPVLTDIAVRRATALSSAAKTDGSPDATTSAKGQIPPAGPERRAFLDEAIRSCVAVVLHMASDEVDSKAALADLGVDSVMTVTLRRQLQQSLKVKVPPTLTWSHPTVSHLVGWFAEKLE
jgi:6-methylsalicylic acid synthase